MKREERIVLDPEEVAIGRIEVNIHEGAIQVREEGPDWGDYEINAFMAKQEMGEVAVDEEIPNRTITIPLILGATGDFDAARTAISAWATKVNHQGGGYLKRELIGGSYGEAGSKLFCDCMKASLKLGGGTSQARDGLDNDAMLTIEALPDFYGERIEEEPFEGVGDAAKALQILGNLPARAEITVIEKGGYDQLAMPWHFRREGYSAEAPWAMNVEEWDLFGAAAKAALAGSAGAKVVTHPSLSTQWTPVAAKTLPHHGAYEVLVRAYTTSETPPEVRFVYDVGDLVDPSENVAVQLPGSNGYYLISLGFVKLEELPIGTHRWRGLLQARGAAGGENVSFDRIWFRSILESSGKPTAPRRAVQGLAVPSLYDGFNQGAGGKATGQSPAIGSAYTVATNSDSDDFEIDAATHTLFRASSNDSGTIGGVFWPGRAIGSGIAKLTNHGIGHNVTLPGLSPSGAPLALAAGYVLRWVNSENCLFVGIKRSASLTHWVVEVNKFMSKKISVLARKSFASGVAELIGRLEATLYQAQVTVSFAGEEILSVEDPDLAPGGLLGEGRAYFYDHEEVGPSKRVYDNFEIWPLTFEAVNFATRKAWLSYKGLYREGPEGGGAYGPIARQLSDLPRVPVSGPEGLPVEVAVLTSRGDLASVADSGRDPLEVQFSYWPCWSQVPAPA